MDNVSSRISVGNDAPAILAFLPKGEQFFSESPPVI